MLTSTTKEKLQLLKLNAFIDVFDEINQPGNQSLDIAEAPTLMADREILARENRRLQRLLTSAKLRYSHACIQQVNYQEAREFNQQQCR